MKKTVSVNIKGLNFLIEEDAYEMLHHYMQRLEKSLFGQKGLKDIIEDIELRIAELCQIKLSEKKQVIEKEDIENILSTLGQPEDFIEDDDENFSRTHTTQNHTDKKQLYRDIDQAKIAGVCAGLSNYFNIDLIIVRIIFLLFLFFGGFGFPIYIILWIILPKANTNIDRLRMRGKPITLDSVKEEVEQAAIRFGKSSKGFAERLRKEENMSKRFSSLGRLIVKIVGFGLITTGIFFLILFLVLFFGGLRFLPIQMQHGFISFSELGNVILSDSNDIFLAWLGIILTVVSIILFLISNGTYVLAGAKSKWTKISSLSLIIFGITGIVICFYIGSKTTREMLNYAEIEKEVIRVNLPLLTIESAMPQLSNLNGFKISTDSYFDSYNPMKIVGTKIINNGVDLIYKTSKDSLYHVHQCLNARSYSYENAVIKSKNIQNSITFEESTLKIDPTFSFPKNDKIRNQGVKIIIEIPRGKMVKVNNKLISPINTEDEPTVDGYLNYKGEFKEWN